MNCKMTRVRDWLYGFFMGRYYPLAVALIVTLGHISGFEFYLNILNVLLAVTALCICDSIRPLFTVIITFSYQITAEHSPAVPTYSDYYFTSWRLPVIISLGALVIFAFVYFVWRNRIVEKLSFKKTRLLIPSLILSGAFVLNGLFSKTHTTAALIFGVTQAMVYLLLFLLFYLGVSERESTDELVDYLIYVALIVAYMLMIQMGHLFIFGDVLSGGGINSDNINLGWVTKNPLGAILVSLIPILFYSAVRKRRGWLYLVSAVLVWICSVLTCSRNALLFGTLIFATCLIIACFKGGERRRRFVGLTAFGIAGVILIVIILREQLATLFSGILNMGFDNNGRFKLWAQAWSLFCDNFLFGSGFFSIVDPDVYVAVEFMPTFAHNTIFELLASTGIVGLLAYLYYRFEIIKMALVRPSLEKTFLTLTVLSVALQSLLDAFVFFYYPVFLPIAALAVLCRVCDGEAKTE